MGIIGKVKENNEKLEKVGFIWVFLFSLLVNLIADESILFTIFLVAGLVFLWAVYIICSNTDFYKWPLFLMVSYPVTRLLFLFNSSLAIYTQYIYFAALVLFGLYTLVDTIRISIKFKNFELLNFLMGAFLCIAPLAILYGNDLLEKGGDYYFYALAFVLATIIYNDNLWLRNSYNVKSLIKYVFVLAILSVLDTSIRTLSL